MINISESQINELAKYIEEQFYYLNLKNIDTHNVIEDEILNVESIEQLKTYVMEHYYNIIKNSIFNKDLSYIDKLVDMEMNNTESLTKCITLLNKLTTIINNSHINDSFEIYYEIINTNKKLNNVLKCFIDVLDKYNISIDSLPLTTSSIALVEVYKLSNNETSLKDTDNLKTESENDSNISSNKMVNNYNGDLLYLQEIGKIPVLSQQEQSELITKYHETGDINIKKKLIESNLRLVVKIAKKYLGLGVPFRDLIEDGVEGLMIAIEKFDPSKGFKLSTYSWWYIKQHIRVQFMNNSRNIRLPVHFIERLNQYIKDKEKLYEKLNRQPTKDELISYLKINEEQISLFEMYLQDTTSLNVKASEDINGELFDIISSDEKTPEEKYVIEKENEYVMSLLNILNEKEKNVLMMLYGINGFNQKTLEEVAEILYEKGITPKKLTRERIRQIKDSSIEKLKNYIKNPDKFVSPKLVSIKNMYSYFKEYGFSEEEVATVYDTLNDEQKNVLIDFYGEDLHDTITDAKKFRDGRNQVYNVLSLVIKPRLIKIKKDKEKRIKKMIKQI